MLITHDEADDDEEASGKNREIVLICALIFFSLSHSASAQSHDELIGGELALLPFFSLFSRKKRE
jgi:hypothetical protein